MSRYSTAVRRVNFELGIRCRRYYCLYDPNVGKFEEHRIVPDDPPYELFSLVSRITRGLPNLRGFYIKAPRAVFGLRGGRPRLDWQEGLIDSSSQASISHLLAPEIRESDIDIAGATMVIRHVLTGLQLSGRQPTDFGVIGFTNTLWQSIFAPGHELGAQLSSRDCYGGIRSLNLELSTCRVDHYCARQSQEGSAFLATTIDKMPNLHTLVLSLEAHKEVKDLKQSWDKIIFVLANTITFHLQDLELRGIGSHTPDLATHVPLDRVITRHKSSLHRVVLDRIVYRAPHSIRSLFASLADTRVTYLAFRNFDVQGMRFAYLTESIECMDDENDLTVENDGSYAGWVTIDIEPCGKHEWLRWYNMQDMDELLIMNERQR